MIQFETKIAYFFGVANPDAVACHYMKAISLMGNKPSADQKTAVLIHLTDAYNEVAKQTHLVFDTKKAAEQEYDLILAHSEKRSFEDICVIMENLYKTVFGQKSSQIQKAAILRTFLYQYKSRLTNLEESLSKEDQVLLLAIASASERELNQLLPKK